MGPGVGLVGGQFHRSPVVSITFDHPILVEEDNEAVLLLLDSLELKEGNVGKDGFFQG